ncbi:MAG: carbamoyl-phosphate synthase small subunit [Proteobacteria bacterium]|nr:MAG: carbamoyl-phosphate synthase small subunit [Pseudomonadota bacterium]
MTQPATLALEDGSLFTGISIGVPGQAVGEVVFNTAMTGYQEILTDPSYAKQIVTLTYPHIGNTGTNAEDMESAAVFAAGFVIRDLPSIHSNWRVDRSLAAFLREQKVVAIAGIDTRRLTRLLREKGAQNGCIVTGGQSRRINKRAAVRAAQSFAGLKGMDLAQVVSTKEPYEWTEGSWQIGRGFRSPPATRFRVVAYDFGIKRNILRMLTDRGCAVTVVPAKISASQVLALKPDGVFLSNGPGDPEPCTYAIESIATLVDRGVPTFGICLGHQLLALAAGARTLKMKFGHHGANHPVLELGTGRVLITSQNHGFAVDSADLPQTLRVTHRSLFDDSIQGLVHTDRPAFSFQGHPEASPGPQDINGIFDRFIGLMEKQLQVSRNKMQRSKERIAKNL